MNWNELRGKEVEALANALLKAFPTPSSLRELAWVEFDKNLDEITEGPSRDRVFSLIRAAEAEGWTAKLVAGARRKNPGNPVLLRFYNEYVTSVQRSIGRPELERIVDAVGDFLDVAVLRDKLSQVELQVCRVEVSGKPFGTGFLVGKDVVLTNYHVIEGHDPGTIAVRFDHKVLPDGSTISEGKTHEIVTPVLDQSPYSLIDSQYPKTGVPGVHELDYAFLRVSGAPGDEIVDGRRRGFVEPASGGAPTSGLVFIVQHPMGQPLKVAFDRILELNANRTRMTYRTNTERGSSGSPCFDVSFRLVALHHSGDPRFTRDAEFNEGIPVETIRSNMKPELRGELGWI